MPSAATTTFESDIQTPLGRWRTEHATGEPVSIIVDPNDPLQGIPTGNTRAPVRPSVPKSGPFSDAPIGHEIDSQIDQIKSLVEELSSAIAQSEPKVDASPGLDAVVPKAKPHSRRDAVWAFVMLAIFVIGGASWHNNQMGRAQQVIDGLTTQLENAKLTLMARINEAKVLYEKLNDANHENAKLKRTAASAQQNPGE